MRRRLLLTLAAGLALLIAATGVFAYSALETHVNEEFDTALRATARALVTLTEQEDGVIELDYPSDLMPGFERDKQPDYFQYWLDDGTPLVRSKQLKADLPFAPAGAAVGEPLLSDITLPDGRAGRMVQIEFMPRGKEHPEQRRVFLAVARGRERVDGLLSRLGFGIAAVAAAALLLSAVLVWSALAAGLRPLDRIAQQVETLDADSLDARIALPQTPVELAPIVGQLNGLLARLQDSFDRERRFTGNVAHELRTPIAELRSLAEVGARWPDDKEAVAGFFDDVGAIAGRMEHVIADLLLLARCHAGVERIETSATDLAEVVEAAWARVADRALERGLSLRIDLSGAPPSSKRAPDSRRTVVESDPGKLGIVLDNLFGNAVSYARRGTEIRCVAGTDGDVLGLEVENEAEPMSPGDLDKLAEPFWRQDEARADSAHAGLGLSVVAAVAQLLGLELRFQQAQGGTFRVGLNGLRLQKEVS